ncbi:protein of unknown function [Saccharopolyspora kobensis]|uniref:DUF1963 domain-containing protein n=1 Tax=Saccharopolyspora kobensis TaxID=146035 RepID=A0A1H5VNK4_9PSEU|nr:DUF1963 domain-containing protein [Saccharopolyspora kobensis]SEF88902.1 protein of unknown function [Saccharopolyspora kobensis]SFC58804.1 protein of unknown function [Saccharopolyspora kobensis]
MTDTAITDETHEARAARFRAEAAARGIPAAEVEAYIRTARTAIYLAADGPGPKVALTGGNPPLPEGAPAPKAAFVAAVDCAALPLGATDLPLPTEGRLLFFADPAPGTGAVVADAVRYLPAGQPATEDLATPDDGLSTYRRARLDFCFHQWSWPWHEEDDDEESQRVAELESAWSHAVGWRPRWRFQLGGEPILFNWDPVEAAQEDVPLPAADGDEWALLATWRGDDDCDELEAGLFHWVIRRADLAALRFDRVYVYVDAF